MKVWSHPNPEAAGPGEIVGIYPFTLSPEESELVSNHLFAVDQDFPISHYIKEKYFLQMLNSSAFSTNAKRDIEAFLQSQAIHRTHCYVLYCL